MQYKNIEFISFDARKHCDYWMRDMVLQRNQFVRAAEHNYLFPSHFYEVTPANLLHHLQDRHELIVKEIAQLPVSQKVKDQECALSKRRYEDCDRIIRKLLRTHKLDAKSHFIDLIKRLHDSEIEALFMPLMEEQSFSVGMGLLGDIIKLSEKHPLCVVHAGAYHSYNIEKRLLSHCKGFEKDKSCSMTLPGLVFGDLMSIEYPKQIPDTFMNKKMECFITGETADDSGCIIS